MPKDKMSSYGPLSREMLNMVANAKTDKYAAEMKAGVISRMKAKLKSKAKERSLAINNKAR